MGISNLSGQTLGQYELRELLGVGGMGSVYRGYQTNLKRYVAIKIMTPEIANQPGYIERFNREAETAALLEHQNIITIHDYGTQRGISYVVMRLLTGGTLADRLALHTEEGKPLPSLGEIAQVLRQLGSALDYAHSHGVIHRDIKPSNVMFDNQGNAYLVDFGIAKLLEATKALTGAGTTLGTPTHMPPEQWKAEPLTAATDQYALGVLVYSMLTGRPPFDAPTPYALMHKHLNEIPTPPQVYRAEIPPAVADVLNRALAKLPQDRFPTCTAFAQAFESAIAGQRGAATQFFSAPVRLKPPPVRTPSGGAPSAFFESTTGAGKPLYRYALVWGLSALVIVMAAVIAFLVLGGDADEQGDTPSEAARATVTDAPPDTTPAIAILDTDTPTVAPSSTPTDAPSATFTVTVTASPTPDMTGTFETGFASLLTATAESWTATPSPTPLPTDTLTPSVTPSNTPDATGTVAAAQTATAAAWTPTPTATDTPTLTFTPTATATSTLVPIGMIRVGATGAIVRATPDVEGKNLGTVPPGTELPLLGTSDDGAYYHVLYDDQSGWINNRFAYISSDTESVQPGESAETSTSVPEVSPEPPTVNTAPPGMTVIITISRAAVRSGPQESGGYVLGYASKGEQFTLLGISSNGAYYVIAYRDSTGWIKTPDAKTERTGDVITPTPVSAEEAEVLPVIAMLTIGTGGATVWQVPTDSSRQIGIASAGMQLQMVAISGNGRYYQVVYQKQLGWINTETVESLAVNTGGIEPISGITTPDASSAVIGTLTIGSSGAVIYVDASESSVRLGTVIAGMRLSTTGANSNGQFYRVVFQNQYGWVLSSAVAAVTFEMN